MAKVKQRGKTKVAKAPMTISERMSRIRSKDTLPELQVRQVLHKLGYRYRLHLTGLPGSPDIVFKGRRKVIFVHGCFWHQHEGCKVSHIPKSNSLFWQEKLERNRKRDTANQQALIGLGWEVMVVWECELADAYGLARRMQSFLGAPKSIWPNRGPIG